MRNDSSLGRDEKGKEKYMADRKAFFTFSLARGEKNARGGGKREEGRQPIGDERGNAPTKEKRRIEGTQLCQVVGQGVV
jgi:hypothetical protein